MSTARNGSTRFHNSVRRQIVLVVKNKITADLLYQAGTWWLITLQQDHRFFGKLEEDLAEHELRQLCIHVLLADSDAIELKMA